MNIAMEWNHYLQVVGEPGFRQDPYRSLTDAEKEVERLRRLGVRVAAIYSKPALLVMCSGGPA